MWGVAGGHRGNPPDVNLQAALNLLMAEFNFGALDADPGHLHLHAGLVTKDDRAVIVAADRNTGKTTTVAHLVARGWNYVTDEMVRLAPGHTTSSESASRCRSSPVGATSWSISSRG